MILNLMALVQKLTNKACPDRGPVRPKQCQETSPKCVPSKRFWYVREHFGRRRNNAPGSSDPSACDSANIVCAW